MTARLAALALSGLLILISADHAYCRQKPLKLQLTYTTLYGGLKTVISPAKRKMPKLGLALAGGGAKAAAAIGVLRVLDKEGIPIAAVVGTSMGAGVGGLYAAGYNPDEIEQIFLANDWNDIFTDTPARAFLTQGQKEAGSRHLLEFTFSGGRFMPPSGLSAGQKLTNLLAAKTLAASFEADLDFDKLKVPFRAVATDIETGDPVVLGRGLLHEAIRASTAIPLVFQPVEMQGHLLVDGGLTNNLPVDVVKSFGVDVVIAVDSSAKLEKRERLTSLIDIMGQSISLQVRRESERQAALADLVILPDTSKYAFTAFPSMKEIIAKGEEAARAALPRIRELMRPKTAAQANAERFHITRLTIRGNVNVSDAMIRNAMAVVFPRETTSDDALDALAEIYRLGFFAALSLELKKEGKGAHALLTVQENPLVKAIQIKGNTILSTNDILTKLSQQQGRPLNTTHVAADLTNVIAEYRRRGYLLARVEHAGVTPDNTLEIVIYEGRVDSLKIAGHAKTSPYLIRRETLTRSEQPLNFETAAHDIQHLYALDYFESVSMDIQKSPRGGVDLTFKIKEKPTSKVRLGLRYDLEDHFTGLTDLVADNVGGRGVKLFLNTRYGNYTDIAFGYRSPLVLRTNFDHLIQAFYQQRNYLIYENKHKVNELDITRFGADFAFGYQWFRFGDTYLRYRYTTDTVEETLGANPAHTRMHMESLAFLTSVDTRDKSAFPHTGIQFKGSYEVAEADYGNSNGFTKAAAYLQGNVPLGERHTLTLEGSGGLSSGAIPYVEQFGIGGADYLLGFPLLGYQRREFTGADQLGFSAAYRWKIKEYQLKAVRAVYLNLAAQEANVWDSKDAMSLDRLKKGGGIGLHADTIIGPIRLDYGVGEQRRYTVYFSAGFDF